MTRYFIRQTLDGKEVAPQLDSRPPGSFPGQCRLPRSRRGAGIGSRRRIWHMPFDIFNGKAGRLRYDLN